MGTTSTPVTGPFAPSRPGPAPVRPQQDLFSSESFLLLLASQMRNQNPLEPVKDLEFIGQMAQFSTLEQVVRMNRALETLAHTGQLADLAGLIGRQVTYDAGAGTTRTGTVERLELGGATRSMHLVVDGALVSPADVVRVEPAA